MSTTDSTSTTTLLAVAGQLETPVRQHTPGPWRVHRYAWQRGNVSVFASKFGRAPYGACVAYTPCSDGIGGAEGAAANACLIAAAPDLLDALERLLASGDVRHAAGAGALKQARAAIAKAVGSAA
jgi:hypothetical protein